MTSGGRPGHQTLAERMLFSAIPSLIYQDPIVMLYARLNWRAFQHESALIFVLRVACLLTIFLQTPKFPFLTSTYSRAIRTRSDICGRGVWLH